MRAVHPSHNLNTFYFEQMRKASFAYLPKQGLMRLFWSRVLRQVGVSFLVFFSAIYVYKTAKLLSYDTKFSFLWVVLFYFLMFLSKQVFLSISENLSRSRGFKGIIKLSLLPYFLSTAFYVLGSNNLIFLLLAAVFWGIHASFYWWGYHGYFAKTEDRAHFGFGTGEQEFLETMAMILAPILGAGIISFLGFKFLFITSFVFMAVSVFILGRGNDKKQKHDVSFRQIVYLLWTHKSVSLAYVGEGVEDVFYSTAWPLFLFLLYGQVLNLGIIVTSSLFISAIFGIVIGSYVDKQGERTVVGIGTPIFSLSWLIRALGRSFPFFVLADTLRNFGERMVYLPLLELTYKKAAEGYVSKAIFFRELALGIGAMVALIIMAFLIYLDFEISQTFIIPFIFSLLPFISIIKKSI